jgi:hypothetical protein
MLNIKIMTNATSMCGAARVKTDNESKTERFKAFFFSWLYQSVWSFE